MMVKDGREVLSYPKGVKVELEKGRVIDATGLEMPPDDAVPPAPFENPSGEQVEPAKSAEAAKAAAAAAEAEDAVQREMAEQSAKARSEMEKSILQMENPPPAPKIETKTAFSPIHLMVEVLIRWIFLLVVLKLTSWYWNSEISWAGLCVAAAADVAVRTIVNEVGTRALQMPSLFYADDAVALLVLVIVLQKVSFNRSLAKAVEVAMTAKVFAVLVGGFLFAMLLRFLF